MSKAFSAFNLMFVILPSILCAGIDREQTEVLRSHNNRFHGSNFKMHQLNSVIPSINAPASAIPYLIYGIDKDSKEAYLELWSIAIHDPKFHWGLPTFDKKVDRNDENLTVTLPIRNLYIYQDAENTSEPAKNYSLKFIDGDDYNSFVNFCSR